VGTAPPKLALPPLDESKFELLPQAQIDPDDELHVENANSDLAAD